MKIKVNKHKLNIHYRGSPWGSRTQQHAYCLRYAHSHHIESHLGKKQPQAKIAIAFLFGQLHFNNVTSHALFYGRHLIMRSKKCAMQNQGITLISSACFKLAPNSKWNHWTSQQKSTGKTSELLRPKGPVESLRQGVSAHSSDLSPFKIPFLTKMVPLWYSFHWQMVPISHT